MPYCFSQNGLMISTSEKVNLQTDRTLYVVNETINFSAFVNKPDTKQVYKESKILYCELITPDLGKITGGKFLINNQLCSGCLGIPKDIVSGIYFLRAYTKCMRNTGPQSYSYILLKIVNPGKPDILHQTHPGTSEISYSNPFADSISTPDNILQCDKKVYSTRETVQLKISTSPTNYSQYQNLILCIVPESSFIPFRLHLPEYTLNAPQKYNPETRGLSITGHVLDKQNGLPLPSCGVNLSLFEDKDFISITTDSVGGFYFSLPNLDGKREVFISAEAKPGITPSILIDNDFCTIEISIPSPEFTLSENERNTALKLALNEQVSSHFKADEIPKPLLNDSIIESFYGKPSELLLIDNYVQLPTLEEYFNEIPGIVKVRQRSGKPYFLFSGEQAEMAIYHPLVLLDWVAIDDIEKILKIPPQSILRIEMVNAPYVKGSNTYGGVLNFISRKNDFAGIDLPSSGSFINFDFLCASECVGEPHKTAVNWPDARNTIYWNPKLKLNNISPTEISIGTPDTPGSYSVILRGMKDSGETDYWRTTFEVR
jgi:hypothetical protein